MARLIVRKGEKKETYQLVKDLVAIGRASECTIVVDDGKSSRRHCEVFLREGEWQVRDLGSRNGTLLNGFPVQEERLGPGDVITIGKTTITFEKEDAPAGPPAPDIRTRLDVLELEPEKEEERPKVAGGIELVYPDAPTQEGDLLDAAPPGKFFLIRQRESGDEHVPLGVATVTLGRSSKSTICLAEEASVSSRHAQIVLEQGTYYLEDLGSTNGCRLNRVRVEKRVPLSHGDRIDLGDARFYFVRESASREGEPVTIRMEKQTPGTAGIALAPSAAAGGFAILAFSAGLVLALFGGLLAFYFLSQPSVSGTGDSAGGVPGNKLRDGSFEEAEEAGEGGPRVLSPARWLVPDAGVGTSQERARSGKFALVFGPAPEGESRFHREASTSEAAGVSPARTYEIAVWVLPLASKGAAGVELEFVAVPGEGEETRTRPAGRRRVGMVAGEALDWTQLRARFRPPPEATAVRVECFVAGPVEKVLFDDASLVEVGGDPDPEPVDLALEGGYRFQVDSLGVGRLSAGGAREERLSRVRFVGEREGRVLLDQRYSEIEGGLPRIETAATRDGRSSESVTALVTRGRTVLFGTGGWLPFEVRAYPDREFPGVAIEVRLGPVEDGAGDLDAVSIGLVTDVASRFLESGTGVLTVGASRAHFGAFQAADASQVVWRSGSDRIGIFYPEPLLVGLFPREGGAELSARTAASLAGAADLAMVLRTSFAGQDREYRELLESVRAHRRDGRPGAALAALLEIQKRCPFESGTGEVMGPFDELREEARGAVEDSRAGLARAGFFRQEEAYERVVERCREEIAAWEGTPAAETLGAVLAEASRELDAIRADEARARSDVLLRQAEDFLAQGKAAVAREILRRTVEAYPGTEAAERAKEILGE
ncbi:MAG: FHA domain-containing protein [Planctomycetes bacterium]|nr:FHA domain-containing protein [Planctomycetota bacterium]